MMGAERDNIFLLALGLTKEWYVEKIELTEAQSRLAIYVRYERGSKFKCPICGKLCKVYDTRLWRVIKYYANKVVENVDLSKVRRVALDETSMREVHFDFC